MVLADYIDNMFSWLWYVCLPWFGDFFGVVGSLAFSNFEFVIDFLTNIGASEPLHCVNVFTGVSFDIAPFASSLNVIGKAFIIIIDVVVELPLVLLRGLFRYFGVTSLPFCLGATFVVLLTTLFMGIIHWVFVKVFKFLRNK